MKRRPKDRRSKAKKERDRIAKVVKDADDAIKFAHQMLARTIAQSEDKTKS